MGNKLAAAALVFSLVFAGCASHSGWRPTVDPYNDPHADMMEKDFRECDYLAREVAGNSVDEASRGAFFGGIIGAAFGAVFGAIFGDPGTGAAIGAAVGGVEGGANRGLSAEQHFQRAYVNCMKNRGHNVIN